VQSKLRKKLENDGEDLSGVYARLDTTEELDDSKVYRIILRVVVTPAACEDVDRAKRALGIVNEIRKLLAQCSGINVGDADVASESEITLQACGIGRWSDGILTTSARKRKEGASSRRRHQTSKLAHFSNCPLQFFGFIWYKQFTESRCVAAGRSLFESLVSARHLSFERMQSSQSSRPRDLIRKHQ
jgi:hypothetical protein